MGDPRFGHGARRASGVGEKSETGVYTAPTVESEREFVLIE